MTDGPFIHPDAQAFLAAMAQQPALDVTQLPVAESRARFAAMGGLVEAAPDARAAASDIAVQTDAGRRAARLFTPREDVAAADAPLMLFLHGGGWVFGGLDSHQSLASFLCGETGWPVLALEYRLAPEHRFPAAHDDALAAAQALLAGTPAGLPPHRGLVLAGDSAGGHLSAATSAALARETTAGLRGQLLLYPVIEPSLGRSSMKTLDYLINADMMRWFWDQYVPDAADRNDARIDLLAAAIPGSMPPTVLLTCSLDPLRDEARAYAARLAEAGQPVCLLEAQGHIHGMASMRAAMPGATDAVRSAVSVLQALHRD